MSKIGFSTKLLTYWCFFIKNENSVVYMFLNEALAIYLILNSFNLLIFEK